MAKDTRKRDYSTKEKTKRQVHWKIPDKFKVRIIDAANLWTPPFIDSQNYVDGHY